MTKTETIISDIYDAWRAQDLDWLASYLPDDFSHMIYIPTEVHPLGGLCRGKEAALERLELIAVQFDCLHFDTSDLMIRKERAGLEIPLLPSSRDGHSDRDQDGELLDLRGRLAPGSPSITISTASRPSTPAWRH